MVGQRVKELRNAANMTQQELAEGIISRTYLSLIEKNTVHPSTNVLKKLSVKLNCTLDDFTITASERNLSLLDIKKEVKWAENNVKSEDYSRLDEFVEKDYQLLESITEYERGATYWVRASYYFSKDDFVSAREEIMKALQVVEGLREVNLYLRCLILLSRIEFEENHTDKAIRQLTKANNVTIYENISNTVRVSILVYLGEYYRLMGENYVSINFNEDALALNRKLNTHHKGMDIENSLFKANYGIRNYEEAEKHIRRAIQYADLSDNPLHCAGTRTNLAILKIKLKQYDEACEEMEKANKIVEEHQLDSPFILTIKLRYAQALAMRGQVAEGRKIIEENIEEDSAGFGHEIMGDICVMEGHMEKAVEYYLKSTEAKEEPLFKTRLYPKLADLYRRIGKIDKSLEYYEKSVHFYDELVTDMI
ncbi:helix-turn-helix domain-containing protein [Macrococcus carouselicus]|uniref:Helix-turn-helix domain-containing protein n=1 Tax=Macrococcus carouselicus TaxID=69969 RepID=A0A9Q8CJA8_9STAP|nr:helix-turn-helix domain-containing protein [Macrococcus carouselicus]TDL96649.1 helix-turn-helix domain-containing protein [Macrococcus carouselicus]